MRCLNTLLPFGINKGADSDSSNGWKIGLIQETGFSCTINFSCNVLDRMFVMDISSAVFSVQLVLGFCLLLFQF